MYFLLSLSFQDTYYVNVYYIFSLMRKIMYCRCYRTCQCLSWHGTQEMHCISHINFIFYSNLSNLWSALRKYYFPDKNTHVGVINESRIRRMYQNCVVENKKWWHGILLIVCLPSILGNNNNVKWSTELV